MTVLQVAEGYHFGRQHPKRLPIFLSKLKEVT